MVELRGKNQIRRFRHAAERLVSQMSPFEGVAGIVYMGGLTRGFADKFSDVDIVVFLNRADDELNKRIRKMSVDEQRRSGIDIDLMVHPLTDFRKWKLDEPTIWDYSKAEVVFDRSKEVSKILKKKLRVSRSFWIRRIAEYAEYLKWYCCPPREDVGTIAEAWIDRGNLVSAHYCLNYSIDLLLGIVFALNREFLPAPKWRVFYSNSLKWLPTDFGRLIDEAMITKNFSKTDLSRRMSAIRKLWREIIPKIEQDTGLTLDSLSKYYVDAVLHQV